MGGASKWASVSTLTYAHHHELFELYVVIYGDFS